MLRRISLPSYTLELGVEGSSCSSCQDSSFQGAEENRRNGEGLIRNTSTFPATPRQWKQPRPAPHTFHLPSSGKPAVGEQPWQTNQIQAEMLHRLQQKQLPKLPDNHTDVHPSSTDNRDAPGDVEDSFAVEETMAERLKQLDVHRKERSRHEQLGASEFMAGAEEWGEAQANEDAREEQEVPEEAAVGDVTFVVSSDPVADYRSVYGDGQWNQRVAQEYGGDASSLPIQRAPPSPKTARKVALTEHFFLDYYCNLLTYLHDRKLRLFEFRDQTSRTRPEERTRLWKQHRDLESAYLRKRRSRVQAHHFQTLAQIGQGGYGQVFLARKQDTGEICALKKMDKHLLQKLDEVQHILTERDVLTQAESPWLVKLLYAFEDVQSVYLAMEFVPGGDLRTLLSNSGILRNADATFYAAEMFIAVAELHRLGYIHRDLKPENFLVDQTGHLKLTDFGLAKGEFSEMHMNVLRNNLIEANNMRISRRYSAAAEKRSLPRAWRKQNAARAYSLVGSPDYMAPEILVHSDHVAQYSVYAQGYDHLVDYWSLGCIVYEFLCGYPPFSGPSMQEVWDNVYHWQEVLERPLYEGVDAEFNLTDGAWDFINRLITHRHQRLSSLDLVSSHEWFHPFNARIIDGLLLLGSHAPHNLWDALRNLPHGFVDPPFLPQLSDQLDRRHFDDFSNPNDMAIYKDVQEKQTKLEAELERDRKTGNGKPRDAALRFHRDFVGFAFQHKDAVRRESVVEECANITAANESNARFRGNPEDRILHRLRGLLP